jgi:hypothetical protein
LTWMSDGSAAPFVFLTVVASIGFALVCLCVRPRADYSAVRSANSSGNSTTSSILRR